MWAQFPGRPRRHGAVDTVHPCLVGGRGDDSATVGGRPDHNRPSAQCWIVPLLDGRIERIHVYMNDAARNLDGTALCHVLREMKA